MDSTACSTEGSGVVLVVVDIGASVVGANVVVVIASFDALDGDGDTGKFVGILLGNTVACCAEGTATVGVVVVVVSFNALDGDCDTVVGILLGNMGSVACCIEGTAVVFVVVDIGAVRPPDALDGDCDTTVGALLGNSVWRSEGAAVEVKGLDIGAIVVVLV